MAKKKTTRSERAPQAPRTRQKPAVRREQLSDTAARMIVKQGYLPLPIEQLAQNSGVSKALFYTYFPDQYSLFNNLLERELTGLLAAGMDVASRVKDLEQTALLCGSLYFEHVARAGTLLSILMTDRYMSGRIERRLLRLRDTILLRIAREARRNFKLSKSEILAALEMMIAVPEEAGRLVFHKELSQEVGRTLCRTLILSSLQALRDPEAALGTLVRPNDAS